MQPGKDQAYNAVVAEAVSNTDGREHPVWVPKAAGELCFRIANGGYVELICLLRKLGSANQRSRRYRSKGDFHLQRTIEILDRTRRGSQGFGLGPLLIQGAAVLVFGRETEGIKYPFGEERFNVFLRLFRQADGHNH